MQIFPKKDKKAEVSYFYMRGDVATFTSREFANDLRLEGIPVLELDQGDGDQAFINCAGTSASDSSVSISDATTTGSSKVGAIRIQVNGSTKWIRIYDTAV